MPWILAHDGHDDWRIHYNTLDLTSKSLFTPDSSLARGWQSNGVDKPQRYLSRVKVLSMDMPHRYAVAQSSSLPHRPLPCPPCSLTLGLSVDLRRLSSNTASRQQLKRQDAVTDDSVPTFTSALVVTLEVPTLEDLRGVLATSAL